jgi:hypothetical protein
VAVYPVRTDSTVPVADLMVRPHGGRSAAGTADVGYAASGCRITFE